jgi:hypothetical protein
MITKRTLAGCLALAIVAVGSSVAGGADTGEAEAVFSVDGVPVRFVDRITNPYFPLTPGTKYYYEGTDGRKRTADILSVTFNTKRILGVTCVVVRDQFFEDGVLVEQTLDWYAQDTAGNVWYFGEDSRDLDPEGNVVSTHGSWEAGVDDARPGIIMKAHPEPGDRYHQEFAPGVAEDAAEVHSIRPGCVRHGCFDELLAINEWTRLLPGVLDRKFYAKGIGQVAGQTIKGGEEFLELVRIATVSASDAP